MNKKEVIILILFIIGVFLLGSSPSPTGAIIGIPSLTSNFLGLILFLTSLILLTAEEVSLEKRVKNEAKKLLEQRHIPTKARELVQIANKCGLYVKEESKGPHMPVIARTPQGGIYIITSIPRSHLDYKTSRRILKILAGYNP